MLNLEKEFMYYVMDMDQMGNKLPNLYVIKYMVIMQNNIEKCLSHK